MNLAYPETLIIDDFSPTLEFAGFDSNYQVRSAGGHDTGYFRDSFSEEIYASANDINSGGIELGALNIGDYVLDSSGELSTPSHSSPAGFASDANNYGVVDLSISQNNSGYISDTVTGGYFLSDNSVQGNHTFVEQVGVNSAQTHNDDGTHSPVDFGRAGAEPRSGMDDNSTMVVAPESFLQFNDDGSFRSETFDTANDANWNRIIIEYDASGLQDLRRDDYDDGTYLVRDFDNLNTENWDTWYREFDADGNLISEYFI